MYKNNFVKVGMVVPEIKMGNSLENAKEIMRIVDADQKDAILLFPELTITGYTLGDWFFNRQVINDAMEGLTYILERNDHHILIIGTILEVCGSLYNVGVVIENHKILGIIPKVCLPRNHEFNDTRYFNSGKSFMEKTMIVKILGQEVPMGEILFRSNDTKLTFGVEICADLWSPFSPSNGLYEKGAEVVFNCSASTYNVGKKASRISLCESASLRGKGAYVYTSTGITETSSDILYSGHQILCINGNTLINQENFEDRHSVVTYGDIDLEDIKYERITSGWLSSPESSTITVVNFDLKITEDYHLDTLPNKEPFITSNEDSEDILKVVSTALYNRLLFSHAKGVVIGISGGLDSTLALLMSVYMCDRYKLDRKIVHAITMPALATSAVSRNRALKLMEKLNVDSRTIEVDSEVLNHLKLIGHDNANKDITYENAQARYRTLVLMNIANSENSLVVGTGDMSEIALGFSTFNGDQMAMYNVNSGLPKTAVRHLVEYFINHYPFMKEELLEVSHALISPELVSSNQSTEDYLGKYEVNDFIMYQLLGCGSSKLRLVFLLEEIFELSKDEAEKYYERFVHRFKTQQYKRLSGPEGIKIFEISLSPRSDLRMPGDLY